MEELEKIKSEIIESIKNSNNNEWIRCDIKINFPPTTNEGYVTIPNFWGNENQTLKVKLKFTTNMWNLLHNTIVKYNSNSLFNQIAFTASKINNIEAHIEILFSKEVEEDFFNNISKSKRGKYVPWYLNSEYNQPKS